MPERQTYTLDDWEWRALGGTEPPADYDPTVEKRVYPAQKLMGEWQMHHTGLVPAIGEVLVIWQRVADRLGLKLLSILWPDAHYPDFSAEKDA